MRELEIVRDWWGEAPDLPVSVSKAAEVVESVLGRAGKPPSRGPARGFGRWCTRADRTKTRSDSTPGRGGAVGPLAFQHKSSVNVAFPGTTDGCDASPPHQQALRASLLFLHLSIPLLDAIVDR